MAVKRHKPTSPGRRFASWSDRAEVTRDRPEKSLTEGLTKSGGRNTHGRITSRHRGGGAKRLYRKIDFKRRKDGVPAKVAAIEYDPNRSAYIALLHYVDGAKAYILAPNRLSVGRHRRAAHGQGGRLRHAAPALRRNAHVARGLPRHRGHDRQRRSPERQDRQGRPQASHGRSPADARHGDEPG